MTDTTCTEMPTPHKNNYLFNTLCHLKDTLFQDRILIVSEFKYILTFVFLGSIYCFYTFLMQKQQEDHRALPSIWIHSELS